MTLGFIVIHNKAHHKHKHAVDVAVGAENIHLLPETGKEVQLSYNHTYTRLMHGHHAPQLLTL
jgi:hypothetical protein